MASQPEPSKEDRKSGILARTAVTNTTKYDIEVWAVGCKPYPVRPGELIMVKWVRFSPYTLCAQLVNCENPGKDTNFLTDPTGTYYVTYNCAKNQLLIRCRAEMRGFRASEYNPYPPIFEGDPEKEWDGICKTIPGTDEEPGNPPSYRSSKP